MVKQLEGKVAKEVVKREEVIAKEIVKREEIMKQLKGEVAKEVAKREEVIAKEVVKREEMVKRLEDEVAKEVAKREEVIAKEVTKREEIVKQLEVEVAKEVAKREKSIADEVWKREQIVARLECTIEALIERVSGMVIVEHTERRNADDETAKTTVKWEDVRTKNASWRERGTEMCRAFEQRIHDTADFRAIEAATGISATGTLVALPLMTPPKPSTKKPNLKTTCDVPLKFGYSQYF
eukprot:g4403.t1